jgi:hypothetical protein
MRSLALWSSSSVVLCYALAAIGWAGCGDWKAAAIAGLFALAAAVIFFF